MKKSYYQSYYLMKKFVSHLFALAIFVAVIQSCQSPAPTAQKTIEEETPWGTETFDQTEFPDAEFSIADYGAEPTEGVNNQQAIQTAIDECTAQGGGTVKIPSGKWETSYLELKSNVHLEIEEGATLFFSDSIDLYAVPTFTRWEGLECMNYHPLIYARNESNIAITGKGKIDGNGQKWWDMARGKREETLTLLYDQVQAGVAPEERNCLAYEPMSYLRPSLIQTINCKNVLVKGIEIGSGPMWTVHFVYSENVIAHDLKIITVGANNDGVIPDSSTKVLIDNCYFSTGDDCIVIKSGLNEDGWRVGKPSQRIIVKNCKTKHGHGGGVIGSEMSGGVNRVYAYDCDFGHTERGLRVKSMKGRGGLVENLWFKNIQMDSIQREAIKINMHYGSSSIAPRTDSVPTFKNFYFNEIHSSNSQYAVRMQGIDGHKIDSIFFDNLKMDGKYGIVANDLQNCTFKNVKIHSESGEPVQIEDGTNLRFSNSTFTGNTDAMVQLAGKNNAIHFEGTNHADFEKPYASDDEIESSVIDFK